MIITFILWRDVSLLERTSIFLGLSTRCSLKLFPIKRLGEANANVLQRGLLVIEVMPSSFEHVGIYSYDNISQPTISTIVDYEKIPQFYTIYFIPFYKPAMFPILVPQFYMKITYCIYISDVLKWL